MTDSPFIPLNYDKLPDMTFTRMPNNVLETLLSRPELTKTDLRVAFALCRRLFGYHKEWDDIAASQLAGDLNTDVANVRRAINRLARFNIIQLRAGLYARAIRIELETRFWFTEPVEAPKKQSKPTKLETEEYYTISQLLNPPPVSKQSCQFGPSNWSIKRTRRDFAEVSPTCETCQYTTFTQVADTCTHRYNLHPQKKEKEINKNFKERVSISTLQRVEHDTQTGGKVVNPHFLKSETATKNKAPKAIEDNQQWRAIAEQAWQKIQAEKAAQQPPTEH